jgi:hypothetical protein
MLKPSHHRDTEALRKTKRLAVDYSDERRSKKKFIELIG